MVEPRRSGMPRGILVGGLVIAVLYFVWLVLVAGRVVVIRRGTQVIDPVVWVWVGVGLFALLLLLGILALMGSRTRRVVDEDAEPVEAIPAAETTYRPPGRSYEAPPSVAPRRARGDVEIKIAPEDYKGKRVVEVSIPPKSANKGGVYAKAYVPVDDSIVLRIEDLVADRRDTSA